MLKIYNQVSNECILIDDQVGWINVTPRDYDQPPHFIIELQNGFDFMRHTRTCKDCNSFMEALKFGSKDWFLEFLGKKYLIYTKSLGSKEFGENQIKFTNSEYNFGTRIQFEVLRLDPNQLKELEITAVGEDDFENACLYRDLQKENNPYN
jgi:hypothetical protein